MITLTDTSAADIAAAFVAERTKAGSPAMSMVLTLVVVVPESDCAAAMEAAQVAGHEHPARVLGVILGDGRGAGALDAEVEVGTGWTGEHALIRLRGEVTKHADSVVLPLLLPDLPVVVWWATDHPNDPAADPLGKLAQRRITDAALVTQGKTRALREQCERYAPGNTDLAWTRITSWRAMLAAALDQHPLKISGGVVSAEKISPSADLLIAWLNWRLGVPIERQISAGPGITEVALNTREGALRITRGDGALATFTAPGQPDRPVALRRKQLPALLAEELRHLDEDDIYAATTRQLLKLATAKAAKR